MKTSFIKKKRSLRIIGIILLILIFLLFLIILFIPHWLSTETGNRFILRKLNEQVEGEIKAKRIEINWLGKQEIDDLIWFDNQSKEVLSVKHFSSDISLFSILFKRYNFGDTVIESPRFTIIGTLQSGFTVSNYEPISNTSNNKQFTIEDFREVVRKLSGDIHLTNGQITFLPINIEPIFFSNIQLDASFKDDQISTLVVTGDTKQGPISGQLNVNAEFPKHLFEFKPLCSGKNFLNLSEKEYINCKIRLENIPVRGMDELYPLTTCDFFSILLGSIISLDVDFKATKEEMVIAFSGNSDRLKGGLKGTTTNELFTFSDSSKFSLTLTPDSWKAIISCFFDEPQKKLPTLNQNSEVIFSFTQLSMPFDGSCIDLKKLSFSGNIIWDQAIFTQSDLGTLSLKSVQTRFFTPALEQKFIVQTKGHLIWQNQETAFETEKTFCNLFKANGELNSENPNLDYRFSANHFPTALVEYYLSSTFPLTPFIGDFFDGSLKGYYEEPAYFFNLTLNSPFVYAKDLTLSYNGQEIKLQNPGQVSLKIHDGWAPLLFPQTSYQIQKAGTLVLFLKNFALSKSETCTIDPQTFVILTDFQLDSLIISQKTTQDVFSFENLIGNITRNKEGDFPVTLKANVHQVGAQSLLPALLGSNLQLQLQTLLHLECKDQKIHFKFSSLETQFQSDRIEGSLKGSLSEKGEFKLLAPAKLSLFLNADTFNKIFSFTPPQKVFLAKPVTLSINLNNVDFSLPLRLEDLILTGQGHLSEVHMSNQTMTTQANFKESTFTFEFEGKNNQICFEIISKMGFYKEDVGGSEIGLMKGEIFLTNLFEQNRLNLKNSAVKGVFNIDHFPVGILDAVSHHKNNLFTNLIGQSLKMVLNFNYHFHQNPKGIVEIFAEGNGFGINFATELNERFTIDTQKPAILNWQLTPERYHFLHQLLSYPNPPKTDFILIEPTWVKIQVAQLICPTNPPESFTGFLCQSGLSATVHIDPMVMMSQLTQEQIVLQDISGVIHGNNFAEAFHVESGGKILSYSQNASFGLSSDVYHLLTPTGDIDRDHLTVHGILDLNQIAVGSFTGLLPLSQELKRQIRALLGQTVNARISAEISHMTGPLTITLKASNLQATIPAQLGQSGLTLRSDISAELTLTEEVSTVFLKNINPLFITGATSVHPVTLTVSHEGFFLPLRPFDLRGVKISSAAIDLGKIRIANGGNLLSLLKFLKAKGISEEGEMDAWFTPIYMSLDNGNAVYQRFDAMLGNNIHIASWGRIDLNKDKVKMVLAISPGTLRRSFGVVGLSGEYFQLKMKGATSNMSIDWSSASNRLNGLIAMTASGGKAGTIIGSLINILGNILGEETTPPPTTHPFPWSKSAQMGHPEQYIDESSPVHEGVQQDRGAQPTEREYSKKNPLKNLFNLFRN